MTTSHPSRVFANGGARTLYVTIPASVVSDSQFPLDVDDPVTVAIEDGRLVVTPVEPPDEDREVSGTDDAATQGDDR